MLYEMQYMRFRACIHALSDCSFAVNSWSPAAYGYTRARCYSSLTFLVTIGILHIKEIGEGELQKALV